jgi:hypothetical protein
MQTGFEPRLARRMPHFRQRPFSNGPFFKKGTTKQSEFSENYQLKFQPGFWMRNAPTTRLFCCPKKGR